MFGLETTQFKERVAYMLGMHGNGLFLIISRYGLSSLEKVTNSW